MDTNLKHRPLRAGIQIKSGRPATNNLINLLGDATLTGLAIHGEDQKVVVTNLHVFDKPGDGKLKNPVGGEELYQDSVASANIVGTIPAWSADKTAWAPVMPGAHDERLNRLRRIKRWVRRG